MWQRGMAGSAGEAGHRVTAIASLADWAPTAGAECLLIADLEGLPEFRAQHRHVPVLVVLEVLEVAGVAAAIRAGATGVVGEHDDPDRILMVVDRAIEGLTVLPSGVVAAMARMVPEESDTSSWVSEEEIRWLRWMAGGGTVAELADDIGYSERAMFRLLKSMYERLGVKNRTEALLWASQRGLLEGDEPG